MNSDIFTSEIILYQFTSEWYDLYFQCSENLKFLAQMHFKMFGKGEASRKWCYRHWRVLMFLPMMSLIARLNVFFFLQLTSGRLLLQTDFLTLRLLEIHSLKWYFAPFSRWKLCLHPKLSPLNTLDHAKWTRNDWDKVQFWSNIFLTYVENISIFTHAHSWKYWFFNTFDEIYLVLT